MSFSIHKIFEEFLSGDNFRVSDVVESYVAYGLHVLKLFAHVIYAREDIVLYTG